jgi:hypothetical protein
MTYRMAYIGTRADSSHHILRRNILRRRTPADVLARGCLPRTTLRSGMTRRSVAGARHRGSERNDNVVGDYGWTTGSLDI